MEATCSSAFTKLHDAFLETELFIATDVRTSNPAGYIPSGHKGNCKVSEEFRMDSLEENLHTRTNDRLQHVHGTGDYSLP
jgi:hypothetical protein